ncbi:hypothetical protein BKA62DRAFT_702059 [Auriculariales sp. MPI-PUGE-AT-0066]|nr:hypothetical protein BKA62DRAFT_702059 [Auriculariales sp. MPI-PUGE-AT-0066]
MALSYQDVAPIWASATTLESLDPILRSPVAASLFIARLEWLTSATPFDPCALAEHLMVTAPHLGYLDFFLRPSLVRSWTDAATFSPALHQNIRATTLSSLDLSRVSEIAATKVLTFAPYVEVLLLYDLLPSSDRSHSETTLTFHRLRRVNFCYNLNELPIHELVVRSGISTLRSLGMPLGYAGVVDALTSPKSRPNRITHLDLNSHSTAHLAQTVCRTQTMVCAFSDEVRARDRTDMAKLFSVCQHLVHLELRHFHPHDTREILGSVSGSLVSLAACYHSCSVTRNDCGPELFVKMLEHPKLAQLRVFLPDCFRINRLEHLCKQRRIVLREYQDLLFVLSQLGRFESAFGRGEKWL